MANIEIQRKNRCKTPTKHNIVLTGLARRYQRILKDNLVIKKYANDDRFIQVIFWLEDKRIILSHLNRPSIEPGTKEICTFETVKDSYLIFDWHCAYCRVPIKSRIDTFDTTNFTCEKCFNYYVKNAKKIDQRIIESSLEFTENCKQMMIDNQKSFLKYTKKNEKPSSVL